MTEIAPTFAATRPHRKGWEYAMAALFFRDTGRLDGTAEILDVGAGTAEILFWLAGRARRVVAVDTYGEGRFAEREAPASMLADPTAHAPYEYPRDRLEVRRMDARALAFDDASFDAVISLSSIEHFGARGDIARSAAEIGRVLRPGGHALVVTEVMTALGALTNRLLASSVRAVSLGRLRPSVEAFTRRTLQRDVVSPSGLELVQPMSFTLSRASLDNVQTIRLDGRVASRTGEPYPHVTVRAFGATWTSACVPLVKRSGRRAHGGRP